MPLSSASQRRRRVLQRQLQRQTAERAREARKANTKALREIGVTLAGVQTTLETIDRRTSTDQLRCRKGS